MEAMLFEHPYQVAGLYIAAKGPQSGATSSPLLASDRGRGPHPAPLLS